MSAQSAESLLMCCCGLQGQYKQAVACSYETVLLGARTGREDIIANQTVEVKHLDRCGGMVASQHSCSKPNSHAWSSHALPSRPAEVLRMPSICC